MFNRRVINFNAGPAALPDSVLKKAHEEFFNWQQQGVSILELGHRSDAFYQLTLESKQSLRDILSISDDYDILFAPSSTRAHFAFIPLNLLADYSCFDYVETGHWSTQAISQARKYAEVNIVASNQSDCTMIPPYQNWQLTKNAAYLHYTDNETIDGIEFQYIPESPYAPLIADMTSSILSKPLDVNKFGVIYAGAQKNLGIAGLSLIIIRKDLLARSNDKIPEVFNYQTIAKAESLYNTPAVFAWYITKLILDWIKQSGGIEYFYQQNLLKSQLLYQLIDQDDFYQNTIEVDCRSRMNVVFNIANPELEATFIKEAKEREFIGIKGHKAKGGLRVSLYNAISLEQTQLFADFMTDFKKRYG